MTDHFPEPTKKVRASMTDQFAGVSKKVPRFALKPPVATERAEQTALFAWKRALQKKHPELRWLHSSQNGLAASSKGEAQRAKAAGMCAGVPDISLPVPRGGYCGLFVELKRKSGKRSDLSTSQLEWLKGLTGNGYRAEVAFGWEQAKDIILDYLGGSL